jgi:hypothetical protein
MRGVVPGRFSLGAKLAHPAAGQGETVVSQVFPEHPLTRDAIVPQLP